MATGAPSARGRSSQAAYPALRSQAKGCLGAEWSHPLFSAAETQGGSTSLAMTVWYVGIYLLGNWSCQRRANVGHQAKELAITYMHQEEVNADAKVEHRRD
jgi:hypothetical protein